MNKQELYLVPVPGATSTYAPVSHRNIINATLEQLDKNGLIVSGERFNSARGGKQLIGYMDIKYDGNDEMGMRLAFRNSYDKSMSVAFVAGASVWICGNGMISGEIQFMRKHTGSVIQELNARIVSAVNELEEHFDRMIQHSQRMKSIELNKRAAAELVGRMYIEEDLIIPTQLSIVKKEIERPTYQDFREDTLWSLYNHMTYALKESHPITYIQQHKNLHQFVTNEFELEKVHSTSQLEFPFAFTHEQR